MKKIILIITILSLHIGCTSDLDLAPVDSQSELNYWETEEDARIFLNSMYADLMDADRYLFLSTLSDDAYTKGREDFRNIASGSYGPTNGVVTGVWTSRYEAIRRANIFFNNIDDVTEMTEEQRESLKAQGRFIRALHYFYLIDLYGDVPLITDEISIEESLTLERTDESTVLSFIYDELEQSIAGLPESYPSEQNGRITKGAAIALKSRIHLYNEEYEEAANLAQELIGQYSLFPDYGALFKTENETADEIILSLQYIPIDREHNNQYSLIPPSLGGNAIFSPLQELINSYPTINGYAIDDPSAVYDENNPYENRDPRLEATIIYDEYQMTNFDGNQVTIDTSPGAAPDGLNYSSNSTPTGYYVHKYFDPQARNQTNSGLNLILIRYAEVLLNYAEAKIELGTFNQQDWNTTIRAIRARAGLQGQALEFPGNNQDLLRDIVRNERRIELAFEAGHRFFDIRRWRVAEDVLNGWTHGIKTDESTEDNGYIRISLRNFDPAKHYLWPIPQSERDINNNLTQNPNW
ncbi:RagB/SusD family nutrient uptake outer membrane protein [Autumnicola musiva]|uniref:RagB/SusD family nutrient uptake outer membrane protein n=1 Tax=Autumnicola musiva TaxID=3075589 RepID=A0ABU3D963_9FLAO|nr:RagB/SusD family nutrient uptake outer membrane protein [Zunongwangia sp. F117]MDT0677884.1 RagB/SusD family nutrient uptake outer membrane protein [Zunongwangia sp. F117]